MRINLYNIAYKEICRLWMKTLRKATVKEGPVILFSCLCVIKIVIVS
jgi:hypothetical protein